MAATAPPNILVNGVDNANDAATTTEMSNGDGESAPVPALMPSTSPTYRRWEPLPKIQYGFAISTFVAEPDSIDLSDLSPEEAESTFASIQSHLIGLEVGDEVYVFEQLGHEDVEWYRGYVVSTTRVPTSATTTSSLSDYSTFPSTSATGASLIEEPQVYVGIFPRNKVHIRQHLDDAEMRLTDVYTHALESGIVGATAPPPPKQIVPPAHMETLPEEDEDAVPQSPAVGESKLAEGVSASVSLQSQSSGPSKVTLDHSRQSFILQDSQIDDSDRPPPPLPSLKCGDETKSGTIEPLVDEIACALREWSTLMYVYLSKRDYTLFFAVREHIEVLHAARRQLLAQTLSEEEVNRLRRDCVARLVKGNVQQGLDVIVRHPDRGGLVDVDFANKESDRESWISGVRLYALQAALAYIDQDEGADNSTSNILASNAFGIKSLSTSHSGLAGAPPSISANGAGVNQTRPVKAPSNKRDTSSTGMDAEGDSPSSKIKYFHVFLELRAFVATPCQPGETAELYFSLYNKAESRFLTEEFCVLLNHQGAPLRKDKLGKLRAMFTDLSANDMHDLNVVCRIVRNGGMRLSSVEQKVLASDGLDATDLRAAGAKEGLHDGIPGFRAARMAGDRTVRRPFGCAVVELGQDHQIDVQTSTSSGMREHIMPIFSPIHEAAFSTLHQDIIASRVREFEKTSRADLLAVGVKIFYGEKDQLVRENSGLLQEAALTARLGFPDVVFPGDTRNEAYIKLWSGEFFPVGSKIPGGNSARNIQVSVEVRLRDGSVLENAISRGSGEEAVTQFDSTVFYHQNAPTWGELLKLQLPSEMMENCHIFFTFRHRSSKEEKTINGQSTTSLSTPINPAFAHAYLPLFETSTAFIPDGSHTLLLWRTSRSSQHLSPELYFTLPPTVPAGKPIGDVIPASLATVIQPLRDVMTLRTFLVSALYTQNEVLLKLLNWESLLAQDPEALKVVLNKFAFVGEVEIVKFLRNIFDALFGIVVSSKNGNGELDDLVFNALVFVLGIVQDRRFNNFRATLDVYIDQHFHSQTAYARLMASMAKLLADPARTDTSKDLRAAIKVWPYLFRFIVRSRENQSGVKDPIGALGGAVSDHFDTRFKRDLDALLRSINRLMSTTKPNSIIGTQTLALQNFAGVLPELGRIYPMEELARIETAFADSLYVTKGRMTVWKLLHILHLTRDALFEDHASRSQMLPSIVRWVRPHLGRYDAQAHSQPGDHEAARDSSRVAWVEAARLAVTVVGVTLDRLQVSLVNGRMGNGSAVEMRQEQDNVDYILSLMPKLLETYLELDSVATKEALQRHRSASTISSTVPVIFPSSYPFPLLARQPLGLSSPTPARVSRRQHRKQAAYLNCGLGEIAAVLTVLVMLSPRRHLIGFLDEQLDVDGREKLSEFLFNFFHVGTSILLNEAYPSTWLNINVLAHQMVLKMADPLATLLVRDFIPQADQSETFNTQLWRVGLNTLLTLLSSEQLVIERFKPQRRRAVWRLAGDIRGEGAQIFAKLWNSIGWPDQSSSLEKQGEQQAGALIDLNRLNTGGFQVQFVPSLVEPVLELCLSHHDELRTCAVRVLATMITSEWHLNGSFGVIEAEIIDKLDVLFIADTQGDEISRAFFIGQLRSLFDSPQVDAELQEQVHSCLVSVNRFLDLLLSVRSLPLEEGFEDDRVSGTLKLLGFLRQANRVTAFSSHVLRLVNLHLENQNYVEAALTLKLHADLHTWDLDNFVEPIADLDLPRQSHFARKETLYMLILDYLNKGQAWEISIDICRELAREYEFRAVDYSRIADVLTLQASLFQKIGTEERTFPNYFRVAYYGSQWPASLQGKNFVYRGNNWENFSNFCERMHQRHPRATLIKSNLEPNDEIRFSSNLFLQITAVTPEPDRSRDVFVNPETPPIVRAYYEHNTTNLFSFTRPLIRTETATGEEGMPGIAGMWVEKTFLRVEDSFPTVLRRSEISDIEIVQISPIENALLDVENKVKELETLEVKFVSLSKVVDKKVALNTNRLSMALNGAVDAPINGGIPMYKKAFFTPLYVSSNPNDEGMVHKLREAIDRQARVIYRCIVLHSQLCPPEMRPFHETLERFFRQNFGEDITRLQLDMDALATAAAQPDQKPQSALLGEGEAEESISRSVTNGTLSNSNTEMNNLGMAEGGVHLLNTSTSASSISPLQQHIAFLAKQAQPIKSSPTAQDGQGTTGSAMNNRKEANSVVRNALNGARPISRGTSTLTANVMGNAVNPLGLSGETATKGSSLTAGVPAIPPTNAAAQQRTAAAGKNAAAAPSVMSAYSSASKAQNSIFSKVTEGGRERASRLFGSVRRR